MIPPASSLLKPYSTPLKKDNLKISYLFSVSIVVARFILHFYN
nr:MAG TPA: hypothetical protein [Caudoviricetes sp.]